MSGVTLISVRSSLLMPDVMDIGVSPPCLLLTPWVRWMFLGEFEPQFECPPLDAADVGHSVLSYRYRYVPVVMITSP
jgi:hypothetical protein